MTQIKQDKSYFQLPAFSNATCILCLEDCLHTNLFILKANIEVSRGQCGRKQPRESFDHMSAQ